MAQRKGGLNSPGFLKAAGERNAAPEAAPAPAPKAPKAGGDETVSFIFRTNADARKQAKALALELGVSLQSLMNDQLNQLFAAHGKPQIAHDPKP